MNKRIQRKLDVFKRVQQQRSPYHISWYTPHEQAIREHIARGFGAGLKRVAGLLDPNNQLNRL